MMMGSPHFYVFFSPSLVNVFVLLLLLLLLLLLNSNSPQCPDSIHSICVAKYEAAVVVVVADVGYSTNMFISSPSSISRSLTQIFAAVLLERSSIDLMKMPKATAYESARYMNVGFNGLPPPFTLLCECVCVLIFHKYTDNSKKPGKSFSDAGHGERSVSDKQNIK